MKPALEPLAHDEVRVYLAEPEQANDPTERYLALLSPRERARHARFRFDDDRHTYLVAHALLRRVLGEWLGTDPPSIELEEGPHGRPELAGLSSSNRRLRFNLSHTQGVVACAFAWERDIGVDVEHMTRDADFELLSQSVFSEGERSALFALPEPAQRLRFFQYWTLKEAYIKAVGRGLSLPLRAIHVELERGPRPALVLSSPLPEGPAPFHLESRAISDRHLLGVASHGQEPEIFRVEHLLP